MFRYNNKPFSKTSLCKIFEWNYITPALFLFLWCGNLNHHFFPNAICLHLFSASSTETEKQLCFWTLRMVKQAWQHNFSVTSSRTPHSASELDSLPSGAIGDGVLLPSTLCRWAWGVRTTGVKCSLALASTYRCSTNISLGSLLSNRQSLWTEFQVCRNWVFDWVSDEKIKKRWAECENALF